MNRTSRIVSTLVGALGLFWAGAVAAQTPELAREEPQQKLTLKQAVALSMRNSRELALARTRQTIAEGAAGVERSSFLPNFYAGSGAAYTNGFPMTPEGGVPSVFNFVYTQTLFNPPLRGELRAAEERAEIQRLEVQRTRDAVIERTATAYLELVRVRHSLDLLRQQRPSAQKVVEITRGRVQEGLELPIETIRAELAAARIEQHIVQLESRGENLEGELRRLTGLPPDVALELAEDGLPLGPEPPLGELTELALVNNVEVKQAELERLAREHRLKGQRGGYWPSVDLVGQYAVFSRLNNFEDFFRRFQRHNLEWGVSVRIPIFSARTRAEIKLAEEELTAADITLQGKRSQVEAEIQGLARRARELDAARQVARLELELAQENVRVLQAGFTEGRVNLRELEKARMEENDKWIAFLEADFERQEARLEMLRVTGRLASAFQ